MVFSNQEGFDMLMILGESQQNYRAAERLYAERYPERARQSFNVFRRLAARVRTTGQLQPNHNGKSEIRRPVRNERDVDILAAININPHDSSRRIAADSGVSRSTVLRILHSNRYHSYHISLHQELTEQDFERRLEFCNWLLPKNVDFYRKILWTDESTFKSNGEINIHNAHYWSVENPHWMRQVDNQHIWSVNTWCGLIGQQIVGPYFFNNPLNGDVYADFLNNILGQMLEEIPLQTRGRMWLQQDGCPAHYSLVARRAANQLFPNRWIGRGGHVEWPARSPDLTPMDFFFWGRLKDIVYVQRPTTKNDMMQRIRDACQLISGEEILRATDSVRQRLQNCIDQNGRHFEQVN